jgi:hypothetical protein
MGKLAVIYGGILTCVSLAAGDVSVSDIVRLLSSRVA